MRLRSLLLLIIVLSLAVPAVVAQDDAQTITMAMGSEPLTFDPHGNLGAGGPILAAFIYDTLLIQNEDGALEPGAAESWTIEDDGRVITFVLQPDVVFSNGAPLNADAVIFTFQRLQEVGQRSLIYSEISNIIAFEAIDDTTVRFSLEDPSVPLLSALTYAYAGILEPGAVEAGGEDYGLNPVGTGPYMSDSWTPGNSLRMVVNPYYAGHRSWDVSPELPVDTINVVFAVDQSTRVNGLFSGEVDVAYLSSAGAMESVAGHADLEVFDAPARGLIYAGFNTAAEPFNDVNLRQAVAQAMQKDDILLIAADGMGQVVNQPLSPSIFGYDAALESEGLPYDVEAARDLVAAAGYGVDNPLEISVITLANPTYENVAVVMQAQLAEIGINVAVTPLDYGGLLAEAREGNYDILVLRYSWNDPDILRLYLGSESIGAANRFAYSNTELDALLVAGRQEADPAARAAVYADAMRLIMDDVPLIPVYVPLSNIVTSSRLQDVEIVHSYMRIENVTLVP